MQKYLIYLVLGVSGFATLAMAQFSDELLSIDLAPNPQSGYVLSTDGTGNVWIVSTGGGGGGDSTLFSYDTVNNQIYTDAASTTATTSLRTAYIVSTSTATSTFAGGINMGTNHLVVHGVQSDASDGLHIHAGNGTNVGLFGAGNTANSLFYGGVNIDGATRLATSLTGIAQLTSGTVSATATGALSESVLGLDLSASRNLIGGAADFSITSGYVIPTTTRMATLDAFTATPSTVITAGDALTWSGNTLNFDGGNTPAGALGGTWASPTVDDDGHNHTGTTLSSIDISSDTNLSADGTEIILTGDALSLGTALTFTSATSSTSFFSALGTFTNSIVNTLLTTASAVVTSVLQIPNGTGPTADDPGEIAHDTSDNQLILDDYVIRTKQELYQFSIGSTSPAFVSGFTKYLPVKEDGYVVSDLYCTTEGGTSKAITLFGETITCDSDGQADDGAITIATVAAASTTVPVTMGATTGTVNYVNITVTGRYTRE